MEKLRKASREVAIQLKKAVEDLEAQKQNLARENVKLRAATAQLLGDIKEFVDAAEQVLAVDPGTEPSTSTSHLAHWKLYFGNVLRDSEAARGEAGTPE